MAFTIKSAEAWAHELETDVHEDLSGREAEIVAFIKEKVNEIAKKFGGYVTISGNGHLNEAEGRHGDQLHIDINSLPKPAPPEPSGLQPPEASIAAPQQADGSTIPPVPSVPQATDEPPPTTLAWAPGPVVVQQGGSVVQAPSARVFIETQ
jgi:hypothetical protein